MTFLLPSPDRCTSGRAHPPLTTEHKPCGQPMLIVGYTARKHVRVEVCPRCDAPEND